MSKLKIEEGRLFCIIELKDKEEQESFVKAAEEIEASGEAVVRMINISDYGLNYGDKMMPSLKGFGNSFTIGGKEYWLEDPRQVEDSNKGYWQLLGVIIGPFCKSMSDKEAEQSDWANKINEILFSNGLSQKEEVLH